MKPCAEIKKAHRKSGDGTETVPVNQIAVGDQLLGRAGELLPVDGILISNSALLHESTVTGEPLPERRNVGDTLRSGTASHSPSTAISAKSDSLGAVSL
ncbi:MAG: hypothetical protein E5V85_10170 [Mesorhizobium sp.]|nr:MAG: hypothetical protein E5V85_10170 [Mesorhizobium sp.]